MACVCVCFGCVKQLYSNCDHYKHTHALQAVINSHWEVHGESVEGIFPTLSESVQTLLTTQVRCVFE